MTSYADDYETKQLSDVTAAMHVNIFSVVELCTG